MSETVADLTGTEMQTQLIRARTMNDDLRWILGRPNFACAGIAQALRFDGQEIKERAEDEQAAVIHWMLVAYLSHGEKFREILDSEWERIKNKKNEQEGEVNGE